MTQDITDPEHGSQSTAFLAVEPNEPETKRIDSQQAVPERIYYLQVCTPYALHMLVNFCRRGSVYH